MRHRSNYDWMLFLTSPLVITMVQPTTSSLLNQESNHNTMATPITWQDKVGHSENAHTPNVHYIAVYAVIIYITPRGISDKICPHVHLRYQICYIIITTWLYSPRTVTFTNTSAEPDELVNLPVYLPVSLLLHLGIVSRASAFVTWKYITKSWEHFEVSFSAIEINIWSKTTACSRKFVISVSLHGWHAF